MRTQNCTASALTGAELNQREADQEKQMRDAAAAAAKRVADLKEAEKQREQAERDRLGLDPNGHARH